MRASCGIGGDQPGDPAVGLAGSWSGSGTQVGSDPGALVQAVRVDRRRGAGGGSSPTLLEGPRGSPPQRVTDRSAGAVVTTGIGARRWAATGSRLPKPDRGVGRFCPVPNPRRCSACGPGNDRLVRLPALLFLLRRSSRSSWPSPRPSCGRDRQRPSPSSGSHARSRDRARSSGTRGLASTALRSCSRASSGSSWSSIRQQGHLGVQPDLGCRWRLLLWFLDARRRVRALMPWNERKNAEKG